MHMKRQGWRDGSDKESVVILVSVSVDDVITLAEKHSQINWIILIQIKDTFLTTEILKRFPRLSSRQE